MNGINIFADGSGRLALTREETAKALGVSVSTIDKLAKRKLLRPSRPIRCPLYSIEEIKRFLRETTAELAVLLVYLRVISERGNGKEVSDQVSRARRVAEAEHQRAPGSCPLH